ncbi:coiled-coil domain-containing protein 171 [Aplochiton taeniatus]
MEEEREKNRLLQKEDKGKTRRRERSKGHREKGEEGSGGDKEERPWGSKGETGDQCRGSRRRKEGEKKPGVSSDEDLRWKIQLLEKEMLEMTSLHNQEVSALGSQLARLRSEVERGESQRQSLEYHLVVARRETDTERDSVAGTTEQNRQLRVLAVELQQRAGDLEKALDITQRARSEDQHALQQEVEERDRLVISANTDNDQLTAENTQLHTLLDGKEQQEAVDELKRRMTEMESERGVDLGTIRRQANELSYFTERQERINTELEAAQQRVKSLESNIESERSAHLESKFNSEIIQLRVRDLEAALAVEKAGHQEALSSLEMFRQQFREVEKKYTNQRERADQALDTLTKLEKDFLQCKMELTVAVETERRTAEELQKDNKLHMQEKISHLHQKSSQEKTSFLYSLYQRLLTGGVLLDQPHSMLGSFTWAELCDVITLQADALTGDLHQANDRISYLVSVCDSKSVCVRELQQSQECVLSRLEESVKQREAAWNTQRQEMEEKHTHTVTQLQNQVQAHRSQAESLQETLSALERDRSTLTSDLSTLRVLLTHGRRDATSLLSACALLAGALTHTDRRAHTLAAQKALLCQQLALREGLEGEEVMSAARSGLSRLLERLLDQSDAPPRVSSCKGGGDFLSCGGEALASRLGRGLQRIGPPLPNSKFLVGSLQQHFLVFSQRLHSAEVERRSLRLEVGSLRRVAKSDRELSNKDPCKMVPSERFDSVCAELRQALSREQQAQCLLTEQSAQLHALGLRLDTHTLEERDRQHTLSQAVQSLSEARHEVRGKDQSLRILGKHLAGVQCEKREVEESLRIAEEALRLATRSKDSLVSYMKAAEISYQEIRDLLVQSRGSVSGRPLPLQLPRVHLELSGTERILGETEVTASSSRIGWLEGEVSAHCDHVTALRTELQDACLRDNQVYVPKAGKTTKRSKTQQAQRQTGIRR